MKERLINIFAYGDEAYVHSIGWRVYEREGTYEELSQFLQSAASTDHRIAERKHLSTGIDWKDFYSMNRLHYTINQLQVDGVMSADDIYCITCIVDDEIRVDDVHDALFGLKAPDYLNIYITDEGMDFPSLLNDDYFEAIHLLWNNKKFISCLKLVFSMIDTIGFIEYGPDNDGFSRWLDKYCDLKSIGITSDELWQLRNSMVHMTNLSSRKVSSGKTNQLLPRFAHPDLEFSGFFDDMKVFHVSRFLRILLRDAIEKWLRSYNIERGKFLKFVQRYDTIVSESRMSYRKSSDLVDKKICPECGHKFQGSGWEGLDAHWRSKHESIIPYEIAWPFIRDGHYTVVNSD